MATPKGERSCPWSSRKREASNEWRNKRNLSDRLNSACFRTKSRVSFQEAEIGKWIWLINSQRGSARTSGAVKVRDHHGEKAKYGNRLWMRPSASFELSKKKIKSQTISFFKCRIVRILPMVVELQ
jgi:hypothetical protein